ncbi:hypothetical protein TNCV_3235241 [Trichonephila clavipes]|nr:hypothetical protein TNCV_3235241 [Trichonephila clavipes]
MTDLVILNHGQITRMTPELALNSPNYHTTPTGGRFSSRQIPIVALSEATLELLVTDLVTVEPPRSNGKDNI